MNLIELNLNEPYPKEQDLSYNSYYQIEEKSCQCSILLVLRVHEETRQKKNHVNIVFNYA